MLSNNETAGKVLAFMPKEYPFLVWFNFTVNYKGNIITLPIKHSRFSMAKVLLFRMLDGKNYRYVPPTLYRRSVKALKVTKCLGESTPAQYLAVNAKNRRFGGVSAMAQTTLYFEQTAHAYAAN